MSARAEHIDPDDQLRVVDLQQGRSILDRQARRYFGMSGDEFTRAWGAGELDDHPDQSAVTYVAMLIPFSDDDRPQR